MPGEVAAGRSGVQAEDTTAFRICTLTWRSRGVAGYGRYDTDRNYLRAILAAMFSRRLFLPAFALFCIAVALGAAAAPAMGADPDRKVLAHDGIERGYVVRMPAGAPVSARLPLVLVLHGGGGNAAHAERMTGFTEKARQEGFIVVYPEGTGRFKGRLLTWNAGHCCGYAMEHGVDDAGFIAALIDRLVADYPVDTGRIFATGMSNGGMMAHRLGIALSDRLAAIAPVVATVFGDEARPARPVSALMINGRLDRSVPHQGGAPGGRFPGAWDGVPARPALDQARFWADADACASAPLREDRAAYVQWRHACPAGLDVELLLVADRGHAWPGGRAGTPRGDPPGSALNATDRIWSFFAAHPKVSAPR